MLDCVEVGSTRALCQVLILVVFWMVLWTRRDLMASACISFTQSELPGAEDVLGSAQ